MLTVRSDAGIVGGSAFTGRVAGHVVFRVADTLAADAFAMIRSGAQLTLVTIARKVVTLAVVSGDDLNEEKKMHEQMKLALLMYRSKQPLSTSIHQKSDRDG